MRNKYTQAGVALLAVMLMSIGCADTSTSLTTPMPALATESTPRHTPTVVAPPRPTATQIPTPAPTPEPSIGRIDCDNERLIDEIVKLSEKQDNPFAPRILKLYPEKVEEVERTTKLLRCKTEAKLSAGGDAYVIYHYEIDRDGDTFIGYEFGDRVPSPGSMIDTAFPKRGAMDGSDGTTIRGN